MLSKNTWRTMMKRRDFLKMSAAAAASGLVSRRASAQAAELADPAGQADHSLCAGRRQRHHRPAVGGRAEPVVRPAVRHREPRRRRRHDRRRSRLEGGAGRLHLPADAVGGDVGAAAAAPDGLRSAEELCAGRAHRRQRLRLRHASLGRAEDDQGDGRLRARRIRASSSTDRPVSAASSTCASRC